MEKRIDMKLSQAFTFDITGKTVGTEETLTQAIDKMAKSGKTCLLVYTADSKPLGIISEHDIVTAFARLGAAATKAKVADYMTIDVIVAKDSDTVDHALKLMAIHNIRHLPVLSDKGSIIDFISVMDLITKKMVA